MTKDTFCGCFHVTTIAAVMGVLQSVIVVILLSTSGILLDHSRYWKSDFQPPNDQKAFIADPVDTSTVSNAQQWQWLKGNITWWRDIGVISFLEIHLTHHTAFYSLWIVFLAVYAFAFKYHRPALVLPNLIMQVIAVALIMILGGVLIAKLVLLSNEYERFKGTGWETDEIETRYTFYSVLLGALVIGWAAELIFILISIDFYRFLRDMQHTVYPQQAHPHRQQDPRALGSSIEAGPKYPKDEIDS